MPLIATADDSVENVVFHVATALRTPVLILALLALASVVAEFGMLMVELWRRRKGNRDQVQRAALDAQAALAVGDRPRAATLLGRVASSAAMWRALSRMTEEAGGPDADLRVPKSIADFDASSLRRLERTRILVRFGPALGLMGTLIPLAPALNGLASGDVNELTDNLKVAFSITVLGLLVGAVAFAISLVRDRLYGQDLSDLQFIGATITRQPAVRAAAPPVLPSTPAPTAPEATGGEV